MIALLLLASPPLVEADPEVAERWVEVLRSECAGLAERLGTPEGGWRVTVRQASSVADFAARTGRPRFEAAALVGPVLWLQPLEVLSRFDPAPIAGHECVHLWLRAQRIPPLPAALEEALAVGLSGGASRLPPAPPVEPGALGAISARLARPKSPDDAARALAQAVATLWPPMNRLRERGRLVARLARAGAVAKWDAGAWRALLEE